MLDAPLRWTDERVARLRKLWRDGFTATEIARDLRDVTRNAVCGKIVRLGLSGMRRAEKIKSQPARNAIPVSRVKTSERLKVGVGAQVAAINRLKNAPIPDLVMEDFTPRVANVASRRVTILEVQALECRWADEDRNDNGDHTFCGNPAEDGSSYCPAHAALSRGPGTASERAAAGVLKREAA